MVRRPKKQRCRSWREQWFTSRWPNGRPTNMGRGLYRVVCWKDRGHRGAHDYGV